jgi:glycerol uptake facilitator-like aquaporin
LRDAATYWVAQFIGGVLAALAHRALFSAKEASPMGFAAAQS